MRPSFYLLPDDQVEEDSQPVMGNKIHRQKSATLH
jgi:hypothetical protein